MIHEAGACMYHAQSGMMTVISQCSCKQLVDWHIYTAKELRLIPILLALCKICNMNKKLSHGFSLATLDDGILSIQWACLNGGWKFDSSTLPKGTHVSSP